MSDDDRFEGEPNEPPGGGLTAPWEDDPVAEDGDAGGERFGNRTADGADEAGGGGETAADDEREGDDGSPSGAGSDDRPAARSGSAASVGALERLVFLLPRVVALVVLVGLPGAVLYVLMVQYFELEPLYRVIGLLGIAFLARWALRPHVGAFLTPPAERD